MTSCESCGSHQWGEELCESPYDGCGFPGVSLVGVQVRRCDDCATMRLNVPQADVLDRAIVLALIRSNAALSPNELRFICHTLDVTEMDLAAQLSVSHAEVSGWMSGQLLLSTYSELALRVLLAQVFGVDAPEASWRIPFIRLSEPRSLTFSFGHEQWRLVGMA